MTSLNLKKHEMSKVCKEATHNVGVAQRSDQIRSVQFIISDGCSVRQLLGQ